MSSERDCGGAQCLKKILGGGDVVAMLAGGAEVGPAYLSREGMRWARFVGGGIFVVSSRGRS